MRIYGLCADTVGCGWYRIGLPLEGLKAHGGHTVAYGMSPPARSDLHVVEVFIGQRVCHPWATAYWQQVARTPGRPALVYEVDDDLLSIDPSNSVYPFYSQPQIRANLLRNIAVADLVTVTTERLAEVIREHNPNVTVLPNVIDEGLLAYQRPRRERLTIGWAGSSTHQMDFAEAAPALRQFLRRHPEVDLHFVGESYQRMVAGADQALAQRIRHTGWVPDTVQYYAGLDFDIGLAPLRPHVFNGSKSPIKALEYGILGIPVVASDTGPYPWFIQHGQTGFLVQRPHEWGQYLRRLVEDAGLRERMGAAAKEHAAQWTMAARWRAWEETYVELLERRRAA